MPSPPASTIAATRRRVFRSVRRAAGIALVVALVVWSGTLVYESLADPRPPSRTGSATPGGTSAEAEPPAVGDDGLLKVGPESGAEGRPDLKSTLPTAVDNWVVAGPQMVPGGEGGAAEAIFEPLDEELSLVTSVAVYALVQRMESPEAAASALVRTLAERYPESQAVATIGTQEVITGFSSGSRSYFIGWTSGALVVGIDASYKQAVPKSRTQEILRRAGEAIAGAVAKSVRESGIG